MSIVPPSRRSIESLNEQYGVDVGGYGYGFDAIRDGRYFYSVLQQLQQFRASGISVGQGIDRRDLPGARAQLPSVDESIARTGIGLSPSIVGRQTTQRLPNVPIQEKDEEMDLGAIMGGLTQAVDIYGRVKDIQRGTTRAAAPVGMADPKMQPTFVSDTYGVQPAYLGAFPAVIGGVGSMGSKIGTAIAGLGLGLAADEIGAIAGVCSKVKSRRRRRRLATHSDIKDLAALKAILGSGKAFDTWIATRKM